MRKPLFIVMCLLAMTTLNAQNTSGDFTLAPQIGVAFSTYYANNEVTYNSRTSFAVGVIGDYYFNDRWSLRSGLLHSPMGAKDATGIVDKLNFITIPVNANWHFGKNRNWYLNFGPSVSFLTKAESELPNGTTIDLKNFVKSTDVGLNLGIGYKIDINNDFQLFIDYQGYGGFVTVAEDGILPYDIRNSSSAINVGGIFKL